MEKVFSLEELAQKMPVSVAVLRREIKAGRLIAHKLGGRIYIFASDWDKYLDATIITRRG